MQKYLSILQILFVLGESVEFPCIGKDFGHGSISCICNATYCDSLNSLKSEDISRTKYYQITSTKAGQRFEKSNGNILQAPSKSKLDVEIKIDRNRRFQKILGFGGAFTDSAGINIDSLSPTLQNTIINLYYGKEGLEYNFGRVPMAGTDFSTRPYSYDDYDNDVTLSKFNLTLEDFKYKIPFIKQAMSLNPNLKLFASPWSSPKWMKTNNKFTGRGFIKKKYYQVWAEYFVKFLDEYAKQNVAFWGITTQNEPLDGRIPWFPFNSVGWTAEDQGDWIKRNLGPTLAASKYFDIKVMIMDDQRAFLTKWTETILGDPEASQYISGVGMHWYMNSITSPAVQDIMNKRFPDFFLLGTEACNGANPLIIGNHVSLGSWDRAVDYASDIISNLNHFMVGWVDWNLALDLNGGPNWVNNFVDAPIIVDKSKDIFYKQPMYYALGHFSKFIPENSTRLHFETRRNSRGVELLAVERPEGAIALVVLNRRSKTRKLRISESNGKVLETIVDASSITTIVFK